MSESKTGQCLCGAVKFKLAGEPLRQMLCHCKNCQRASGAAASANVVAPNDALSIEGEVACYEDIAKSGNILRREFCPKCGSNLFSRPATAPGIVVIKAGVFDDTSWFKPTINIWTDSAQAWWQIDPECTNFPENPG